MNNIEYTKMASLYDIFYSKKNYTKEVKFIKKFAKKDARILDAGCGTGNHAKLLSEAGFDVIGFDQSVEMIKIAKAKVHENFFVANLLDFKHVEKFDVIISFFAVFNHLKSYSEFKIALLNLKTCLKKGGSIIIDLHNPQKNGQKTEHTNNATRTMKWRRCNLLGKEFSKITFILHDKKVITHHVFKIFKIDKLTRIAKELGFQNICFYENYDITSKATKNSKNIQMVLS